jgi:hypothetical protein
MKNIEKNINNIINPFIFIMFYFLKTLPTVHGAAKPHLLVRQIQPFHLHVRRFAPHCAVRREGACEKTLKSLKAFCGEAAQCFLV